MEWFWELLNSIKGPRERVVLTILSLLVIIAGFFIKKASQSNLAKVKNAKNSKISILQENKKS